MDCGREKFINISKDANVAALTLVEDDVRVRCHALLMDQLLQNHAGGAEQQTRLVRLRFHLLVQRHLESDGLAQLNVELAGNTRGNRDRRNLSRLADENVADLAVLCGICKDELRNLGRLGRK